MSLSIDNTYLTNYYTESSEVSATNLTNAIQSAESNEETLEACKQFEAYLIQQMYKSMQETVSLFEDEEEDSSSSSYVDMFQDNYLEEIANQMMNSGQGLGIAEQLYDSIMQQQGISVEEAALETE